MSAWEDFKNFTRELAVSKPLRWLVSIVTGLTFGGTFLNGLLALTPDTAGFIAFDLILVIITSGLVARLTSRGYTALEEALHKTELQALALEAQKKEIHHQKGLITAQDQMLKQLVSDIKEQNANNMNFYLQQMGLLRFCETLVPCLPEENHEKLFSLLDPPTLADVQGKERKQPTMLQSMIINAETFSDSDSDDESLEIKITQPPATLGQTQPVATQQQSLLSSFYAGAQSIYGSFWGAKNDHGQAVDLALLDSIPREEDLEASMNNQNNPFSKF